MTSIIQHMNEWLAENQPKAMVNKEKRQISMNWMMTSFQMQTKLLWQLCQIEWLYLFRTPHITNRIARKSKAVNNFFGDGDKEILDKELSPNEREESGDLPGGAWNNLDDQTDDAHLYIGKFQSFIKMVDCLLIKHGFKLTNREIAKLPKLGKGNKHWLADSQNPRCIASVVLEFSSQSYTLLEIDTSDGAASLSTMLLKSEPRWINENEKQLFHSIMKKSLGWPTKYFKEQLGEKGVYGHPPSSVETLRFPAT
ncbi:Tn7-like element transposition protein TnsE [Paraglaciecola sp. Hal342]